MRLKLWQKLINYMKLSLLTNNDSTWQHLVTTLLIIETFELKGNQQALHSNTDKQYTNYTWKHNDKRSERGLPILGAVN